MFKSNVFHTFIQNPTKLLCILLQAPYLHQFYAFILLFSTKYLMPNNPKNLMPELIHFSLEDLYVFYIMTFFFPPYLNFSFSI